MTREQAYKKVQLTFDDDSLNSEEQVEIFTAIYGRKPEEDEIGSEWSLSVAATPGLCGCSTRREHEDGACRR